MFGLIRVAIIVLVAYLAYRVVKNWLAKLDKSQLQTDKKEEKIATMVRCQYCAVHIPQNEALKRKGHWYCSEEHAAKNTDA